MISELQAFPSSETAALSGSLVCVVDDDGSIRSSLERLFRSAGFKVETFASAADYLERKPHPGPVCLILDVRMPGLDGYGLQKALKGRCEQIVFLTGHGDVPMCVQGMKAGAVDFLIKPVDDEALLSAAALALERAASIGKTNADQLAARERLKTLTLRESQVMNRVIQGILNKQIAADLGIAEKTVKIHRGRMMRKAGVCSVPELIRLVQMADEI